MIAKRCSVLAGIKYDADKVPVFDKIILEPNHMFKVVFADG